MNELYTGWLYVELERSSATLLERLQLIAGLSRTAVMRKRLAVQVQRQGVSQGESVEIYLYYESTLQQRLNLVTASRGGDFSGTIGRRNWVDIEMLVKEVEEGYLEEMTALPIFKNICGSDEDYLRSRRVIVDWARRALDDIQERFACDPEGLNHASLKLESEVAKMLQEATVLWLRSKGFAC